MLDSSDMYNHKIRTIGAVFMFVTVCAVASDVVKGDLVLNGKTTKLNYAYAWVEPDNSDNSSVELKLLFSEKQQTEPQNGSERIPIALEFSIQLTSPDSIRMGYSLILKEGPTSGFSTGDRIVITSFDQTKVGGRLFHNDSNGNWDIEFSLPLSSVKEAEPLKAPPLGAALTTDDVVVTTLRSYLKALKSGDPGTIRKFTTSTFGKIFSSPEMRIRLPNLKDTFRDDVAILSGFSNGSNATLFIKPSGSNDGSEMGIVKLVFADNQWKVSADIFTKFY